MKYRMIAVDLDGTLLTDDKRISRGNSEALRRANDAGIHIVISTGRAWPGVREFAGQLGISAPVITSNGAMIIDANSGEILLKRDLEEEDARVIAAEGRKRLTSQIVWSNKRLFGLPVDERLADYSRRFGKIPAKPLPPLSDVLRDGISKFLWYDEPERIDRFQREMRELLPPSVTVCKSLPEFLEFFHGEVSKARGLARVAEYFGVSMDEVIAVGDADNDLPMLTEAGLAVAMGNATESVKSVADFVTETNENDGVAHVIARFLSQNA